VPLKITYIEEVIGVLLKTTSFWLNHIIHNMMPMPTRKIYLLLEDIL
jgi:hypothetical protein